MVGRKTKDPDRRMPLKNIYLPLPIQERIGQIAATVTNSAMDVYTQAIRSYFAVHRAEYMAWAKADWISTGLSWVDYVVSVSDGTLRHEVTIPFVPSPLATAPPIHQGTPMVGINWILLPRITVFLVKVAARREALTVGKLVSMIVIWHVEKYWESNYAPLMVNLEDEQFIADAGDWGDWDEFNVR